MVVSSTKLSSSDWLTCTKLWMVLLAPTNNFHQKYLVQLGRYSPISHHLSTAVQFDKRRHCTGFILIQSKIITNFNCYTIFLDSRKHIYMHCKCTNVSNCTAVLKKRETEVLSLQQGIPRNALMIYGIF